MKRSALYLHTAWLISIGNLDAAGFAVYEQSISGLGTAFAGSAAGIEDSSTIFYNPAGLAWASGTEFIAGVNILVPTARFNSSHSSDVSGQPLKGNDGGNAGRNILVPNVYFSTDIAQNLRFGLGVNSPFGLATKYPSGWKGRYEALESELRTVNINPTASYLISERWSVGAGLNAQYLDVDLSNAIDFGTLCLDQLSAFGCDSLGLTPQAADGLLRVKGDNWSWGYNLGVVYQPVPGTRLGIAYRSKVAHTVKGKARFDVPRSAEPLTLNGSFKNTGFRSKSDLPETVAIGMFQELDPKWTAMADIIWTRWSRFRNLTIDFDNPNQPQSTQDFDWKDTLRLSFGLTYRATPTWVLRMGIAYDESPVRDKERREFRIPDADRYWLSWGVGYRVSSKIELNIAYAHLFIDDAKIDRMDSSGHALKGDYDSDIDIFSAEIRLIF